MSYQKMTTPKRSNVRIGVVASTLTVSTVVGNTVRKTVRDKQLLRTTHGAIVSNSTRELPPPSLTQSSELCLSQTDPMSTFKQGRT